MSQFSTPEGLEKRHVRDVYEKIAPYFVGSRHKAWPRVEQFLLSLPLGSLIADVGCGTGKYLGLAPESYMVGSDTCMEFGEIAAAMGHNVVACDNQNLPFRNSCFDAVISVGVIHHFSSVTRRTKALEELYRILQPGGKMLVYVWAFEQQERKFDGQDVLVPYTHYQRNKVLARRSQSTPATPKLQSHIQSQRVSPNTAAASWRSRRAFSLDSSRCGYNQLHSHSPVKRGLHKQDHVVGLAQDTVPSYYDKLQRIGKRDVPSTFDREPNLNWSQRTEETPVSKLSKFLNSVIKKTFDDHDSKRTPSSHSEADTNTNFSSKMQALMSYVSVENREKYSTGEFLSLLARKLFASKDVKADLRLQETSKISADCEGQKPKVDGEHGPGDVVVYMKDTVADTHAQCGKTTEEMNGVTLSVVARLVESIAASSDVESDSSSSADYPTSDSSAAEDWEKPRTSSVTHGPKAFQHTTVNCQDLVERACAADSQYSSSSSLFSTSSASSSSSSSSLASSDSEKKVKSKLFQRYYHVFCAGELVKLIQDGIPTAIVLKEYYDHGNWAVVLEKKLEQNDSTGTP